MLTTTSSEHNKKKSWIQQVCTKWTTLQIDHLLSEWLSKSAIKLNEDAKLNQHMVYPESFIRQCQEIIESDDKMYKIAYVLYFIHCDGGIQTWIREKGLEDAVYFNYVLNLMSRKVAFFTTGRRDNGLAHKDTEYARSSPDFNGRDAWKAIVMDMMDGISAY